jgi:transcriptional regulator with XRE-family HTH domain
MKRTFAFSQPTPESVSQRLRSIRRSRGWTLHDVEKRSGGSIKAVVMGSYERGTRAISLARALELANLFAIPIANLLGEPNPVHDFNLEPQRFDQRRVSYLVAEGGDGKFAQLHNFLIAISQRRGDWNGEILTLRGSDIDTLTLLLEMSQGELLRWLSHWQITLR